MPFVCMCVTRSSARERIKTGLRSSLRWKREEEEEQNNNNTKQPRKNTLIGSIVYCLDLWIIFPPSLLPLYAAFLRFVVVFVNFSPENFHIRNVPQPIQCIQCYFCCSHCVVMWLNICLLFVYTLEWNWWTKRKH